MYYGIPSLEDKTVERFLFKIKLVINCEIKFDFLKFSTCNICAGFCSPANALDFTMLTNVFHYFLLELDNQVMLKKLLNPQNSSYFTPLEYFI